MSKYTDNVSNLNNTWYLESLPMPIEDSISMMTEFMEIPTNLQIDDKEQFIQYLSSVKANLNNVVSAISQKGLNDCVAGVNNFINELNNELKNVGQPEMETIQVENKKSVSKESKPERKWVTLPERAQSARRPSQVSDNEKSFIPASPKRVIEVAEPKPLQAEIANTATPSKAVSLSWQEDAKKLQMKSATSTGPGQLKVDEPKVKDDTVRKP